MKFCNKCQTIKEVSEFGKNSGKKDGLHHCCRACVSLYNSKFYRENKEHIKKIREKNTEKNLPRVRETNAAWRKENKDIIRRTGALYRKNNPEKLLAKNRRYREENRVKVNAYDRQYRREREEKDINYRLRNLLRSRLSVALKGNQKGGSAIKDLGCSIENLRVYLEQRFQSGMSWENHGKEGWHIDHIKPLAGFDLTDRDQVLQACHYTNLQPLWEKENLTKGAKVV